MLSAGAKPCSAPVSPPCFPTSRNPKRATIFSTGSRRGSERVGALTHGSYEKTQGNRGLYRPFHSPDVAVQQIAAVRPTSCPTEGIPRDGNLDQQRFPPLADPLSRHAATNPERVYRV